MLLICFGVGIACSAAWVQWRSNKTDDANPTSIQHVQAILDQRGVKTCSEQQRTNYQVPGYLGSKTITASTNCATDQTPMMLSILEFESIAARVAAQRSIIVQANQTFGEIYVYTRGRFLIMIQGSASDAEKDLLTSIFGPGESGYGGTSP